MKICCTFIMFIFFILTAEQLFASQRYAHVKKRDIQGHLFEEDDLSLVKDLDLWEQEEQEALKKDSSSSSRLRIRELIQRSRADRSANNNEVDNHVSDEESDCQSVDSQEQGVAIHPCLEQSISRESLD